MSTPTAERRVGFLVEGLGRSGGMSVIGRYARHLANQEGWAPTLIVTGRNTAGISESQVPVVSLEDADGHWDLLIATWWTTTEALWALPASRRALFVQGIEQRFYREKDWPDRLAAMTVFDLPVAYIVVSEYMVALLRELRPDAEVALVPNGIDAGTFTPPQPDRTAADHPPLRVLVEGQPTLWFKGIDSALRSVRMMEQPATVTLAVHDSSELEEAPVEVAPDRVVTAADAAGMAALYHEHDVLLKMSRFEGFGLPVLEALHTGTPVITTPYTGHAALIQDSVNGLVVDFDDEAGTAAALDLLARDRELLEHLGEGAIRSVQDWPSADEAAGRFEQAIARLVEQDPGSPDAALDALMKRRRATTELAREALRREHVLLDHTRGEVKWYQDAWEETKAIIRAQSEDLARITSHPAFRAASAVRRAVHSVRPRR